MGSVVSGARVAGGNAHVLACLVLLVIDKRFFDIFHNIIVHVAPTLVFVNLAVT